jgi:intergrase/recombinase
LNGNNRRVFSIKQWKAFHYYWGKARDKTGLDIKRKDLRDWFCCKLGELGIQDRYIDASCGKVPKSVLSGHYTDYSPKKLKAIYDKAQLRILS